MINIVSTFIFSKYCFCCFFLFCFCCVFFLFCIFGYFFFVPREKGERGQISRENCIRSAENNLDWYVKKSFE